MEIREPLRGRAFPSKQITLRKDKRGGDPRSAVAEVAGFERVGNPFELILYVHGYNNTQQEAADSYDKFTRNLLKSAPYLRISQSLCALHWPGDSKVGTLLGSLVYPKRVSTAVDCAKALSNFLSERRGPAGIPCVIYFVGHSLGCRLILEAIRNLAENSENTNVTKGFQLMAAAVPAEFLNSGKRFEASANRAAYRVCCHSTHDVVLKFAFGAGQLASMDRKFTEAVGLHGKPESMWSYSESTGFNHGDYWESERMAINLRNMLKQTGSRELLLRSLDSRALEASDFDPLSGRTLE